MTSPKYIRKFPWVIKANWSNEYNKILCLTDTPLKKMLKFQTD